LTTINQSRQKLYFFKIVLKQKPMCY